MDGDGLAGLWVKAQNGCRRQQTVPLAATAAPAGPSCLQKAAAGNLGSGPLCFCQWDHADPGLSYAPSYLLFSYCGINLELLVVSKLEAFLKAF